MRPVACRGQWQIRHVDGTENELSPWVVPLTMSDANAPFGSIVPSASKFTKSSIAFDTSVFAGCKTIGFKSEPMKQLGPRSTPGVWLTRWILMGSVTIGARLLVAVARAQIGGRARDGRGVGVSAHLEVGRTDVLEGAGRLV
jgi:hypothetical protein